MKEYKVSQQELDKEPIERGSIRCPACKGHCRYYGSGDRKNGLRKLSAATIMSAPIGGLNFGSWRYYECLSCGKKWRRDFDPVQGEPCQIQHNKIEEIEWFNFSSLLLLAIAKKRALNIASGKKKSYSAYIDLPSFPWEMRRHICANADWRFPQE